MIDMLQCSSGKILSKLSQLANLFSGILKTLSNDAGLQSLIHNYKIQKALQNQVFFPNPLPLVAKPDLHQYEVVYGLYRLLSAPFPAEL